MLPFPFGSYIAMFRLMDIVSFAFLFHVFASCALLRTYLSCTSTMRLNMGFGPLVGELESFRTRFIPASKPLGTLSL